MKDKLNFFFRTYKFTVLIWLPVLFFTSCSSIRNVTYFQDLTDTSKIYTQLVSETYEIRIQPDDVLEILINSPNADAAAPFNLGNQNQGSITGTQTIQGITINSATQASASNQNKSSEGYLVDKNGIINFPVIGDINVQGLTLSELKAQLKSKLDKYLQNPIINVRLLNYKVTVLGEVARPAAYGIPSERITIIDAIGMAGDLTIFGKRENVLLIREEDGQRKFIRMNLNSSNIFQSPYYYLKQNDIIYVEPDKSKVAASDIRQVRNISIITAALTLLIVLFSRIK